MAILSPTSLAVLLLRGWGYSHMRIETALYGTKGVKSINRVPVKGFEGLYEVDRNGNVYSIVHDAHRRKRQLKAYPNENGYMKVNLYDSDGKCKKKYVHRLIAEAFIPNPLNKPNINHKDCNVANNKAVNLEWCTQSENVLYAVKMGRHVDNISKYNNRKRVVIS